MSIKQNGGVFGRNPTFNDVTIEGDLIINGEVFTGLDFQGSWNASTNSPTLSSGTGTKGEFYIVSVAGTTSLDGITNWGIGDWALFNGTVWQRVEGGADGNFVNVTATGTIVSTLSTTASSFNIGTIGSVGNTANDVNIFSSSAGHNGLRFHANGILPTNNSGAIIDADADLGDPNYRFLDLYLSGGVYLGGSVAANLLDDYESGTWTPTQGNFDTWTSPTFSAKYVKIGKLVTLFVEQTGGTIESSAVRYMEGLPFTPSSENGGGTVSNISVVSLGTVLIKDTGSRIWFPTPTGSQTSLTFQATYSVA
jgi:hypothetical protein